MSDLLVIKGPIEEGTSPYLFARLVDGFGVPLTTADVQAGGVTLNVYDLSGNDPNVSLVTQGLDPATTYNGHQLMYSTMQTNGWKADDVGYCFFYMPAWSSLTPGSYGGHVLRWEFVFDLSAALGSGKARANFETPIRPMKSS